MCGIVGYVGNKSVADILVDGLEQLEYRGYDSSGVAVMNKEEITVYKAIGKLNNLRSELSNHLGEFEKATMGIGHIRWATHGAPTVLNAHPHTCNCGNLVLVHNGIIENYKELRETLTKEGCVFRSQTDTEVVAHLVARMYAKTKDLAEAVVFVTKAGLDASVQRDLLEKVNTHLKEMQDALTALQLAESKARAMKPGKEQAFFYKDEVKTAMDALRVPADKLEVLVDKKVWPFPTYADLIFEV